MRRLHNTLANYKEHKNKNNTNTKKLNKAKQKTKYVATEREKRYEFSTGKRNLKPEKS
jgi:hypothetical protein